MGKKIVLTGVTLTDTDAPRLATIDPVETPDTGSLFLFDFSHPRATPVVGVPSDAASVENLLAAKGAATISGTASATWQMGAGYDGTKGRIERSTKGGLHGVISPSLGDSTVSARIKLGTDLAQYVLNHTDHDFFISLWGYNTKATSAALGSYPGIRSQVASNSGAASNYLWRMYDSANTRISRASGSVGPQIINYHKNAWTGTPAANTAALFIRVAMLPTDSTFNSTDTMRRAQGGYILYRMYLEDLTASGRSYDTVDAIDFEQYTKHVLTAGGRYYGDTYTDPTTLV